MLYSLLTSLKEPFLYSNSQHYLSSLELHLNYNQSYAQYPLLDFHLNFYLSFEENFLSNQEINLEIIFDKLKTYHFYSNDSYQIDYQRSLQKLRDNSDELQTFSTLIIAHPIFESNFVFLSHKDVQFHCHSFFLDFYRLAYLYAKHSLHPLFYFPFQLHPSYFYSQN